MKCYSVVLTLGLTFLLLVATVREASANTVTLTIPKLEQGAGSEVAIPLEVKNAKGMSALQVLLTYDPMVLEVVQDSENPDAALTRGKILPENAIAKVYTTTPGKLPILFLGGADPNQKTVFAVEEDGTLLSIRFRVIGSSGQKSTLNLEKAEAFQVSDIDMLVKTAPGELSVTMGLPWWWYLALIPVILLFLLLLLRRRKGSPNSAPPATEPLRGGPELVALPLDEPGHTCTNCGRVITIPPSLIGKRFKCPGCGAAQAAAG